MRNKEGAGGTVGEKASRVLMHAQYFLSKYGGVVHIVGRQIRNSILKSKTANTNEFWRPFIERTDYGLRVTYPLLVTRPLSVFSVRSWLGRALESGMNEREKSRLFFMFLSSGFNDKCVCFDLHEHPRIDETAHFHHRGCGANRIEKFVVRLADRFPLADIRDKDARSNDVIE